ncbi:N-formylglutamate amidohydrolase [Pseudobacteriovorax antillogorgiicola]|uniref:N-formylglutamate deformylase n=1 Tax=Pseudobacteriovorax antillogorgiicola TaxID=1513793 RepID=A0A1Y6C7F0_9BACT|nr:N-formylglutamate amidohydrolase [Pseudobacteriovorax antillogorgiicola]TCS49407.1 N-formylglutamate deformylase [Pseudobacteriovorax antillogorgiicola]SMF46996.1 N-formylglutamate deformylase [Pseudobacteriovorax antillogorgiicola]
MTTPQSFHLKKPKDHSSIPIVISAPHVGLDFPDELKDYFPHEIINQPDDTDWYVDRLYEFAPQLGITVISAKYSRYVIDLNRSPEGKSLYNDGRTETSLVPVKDFSGTSLYSHSNNEPDNDEIQRRLNLYYQPYHQELASILGEKKERFGKVLLYEAHSIRRHVPLIRTRPFPDLILGDNQGSSCDRLISQCFKDSLETSPYHLSYNDPFQGGFLTRNWGKPDQNFHSIQMEISQDLYLDESNYLWQDPKANKLSETLQKAFENLIKRWC